MKTPMAPQQKLFLAALSIVVIITGVYSIFWGPLSRPDPERKPIPTAPVDESSPVEDLIEEFGNLQQDPQEDSFTAIQEIYDAVGVGENLKCNFNTQVIDAEVYMKGPLIFSTFTGAENSLSATTSSAQLKNLKTYILVQEDFTYFWSDDTSQQATKIPSDSVNPDALLSLSEVGTDKSISDIAQESCTAAQTADSFFQPPAGLEFVETAGGLGF